MCASECVPSQKKIMVMLNCNEFLNCKDNTSQNIDIDYEFSVALMISQELKI